MTFEELEELHNICPIANLASVLELGVLSNERANKIEHHSVAMAEIQDLRAKVVIPNTNKRLHTYANVYFYARNVMMYKRRGAHADLTVLRINKEILKLPGVIIADQNAASGYVRFSDGTRGLRLIDKAKVFSQSWTHPNDTIEQHRHRSAMCAEVLVPDRVPPNYLTGVYVSTEAAAQKLQELFPQLKTKVNGNIFFQ